MIAARENRWIASQLAQAASKMRHHGRFSGPSHRQPADTDYRRRKALALRPLPRHVGAIPSGPTPGKRLENDSGGQSANRIGHTVCVSRPYLLCDAIDDTSLRYGQIAGAHSQHAWI